MSAPPATRVRLSDPAELIAAVPHLLGFRPRDSLVLITLDGKRLGLTLRADLVPAGSEDQLAEQLLAPVVRQRPTGAMLLVLGGEPAVTGGLPHRGLVDTVDGALAAAGIPVVHAAWAASTTPGVPWCCYDEPGCAGTVPDPAGSPIEAASVAAGTVTFDSREELAALLTPDDPAVLARRAVMLDAADRAHPLAGTAAARGYRVLRVLLQAAAKGRLELDDSACVEAASALCDHRIRDSCLAWSDGDDDTAAEQLWLALTRATPAPQRAEPATLLG
ncbi:MAG: DUF4192 domain-containing protein, partial [Pseudonocardiaceae bacterium]